MSDFFDTPLNAYDNELEHHGIKGQKWGVRNAEWYPIDAYRKAKGIVVDAANSNAAKKAASVTKDVASKTKVKAKEAVEFTKKTAKKMSDDRAKKKAKKQERKAEATRAKEEHRRQVQEDEKKRIINNGTPGEVLKIADQLTNDELAYAKNRNDLLKQLRDLDQKQVKSVKDKALRKKWGKYLDAGETLKALSQPVDDVATALERYNKFRKAVNGSTGKDDNDKKKDDSNKKKDNSGKISGMPASSSILSPSEKQNKLTRAKERDLYDIDFVETIQNDAVLRRGGKDLLSEYSKFLNNPDSYMSSFKESTYQRKYKNRPEVREAMRIAKSDGWDALSNHQKELLNELQ